MVIVWLINLLPMGLTLWAVDTAATYLQEIQSIQVTQNSVGEYIFETQTTLTGEKTQLGMNWSVAVGEENTLTFYNIDVYGNPHKVVVKAKLDIEELTIEITKDGKTYTKKSPISTMKIVENIILEDTTLTDQERADGLEVTAGLKLYAVSDRSGNANLYLSTTQVKDDIFVPFTLEKGNNFYTYYLFKKISNYQVVPTHLTGNTTTSGALRLESKTELDWEDNEAPGSKPGVVVSFTIPKVIDANGVITSIQDVNQSMTFIMQLSNANQSSMLLETVKFEVGGTDHVIRRYPETAGSPTGQVYYNTATDKVELYFADEVYAAGVFKVGQLADGMVVETNLREISLKEGNSELYIGGIYNRSIRGATYMHYQVLRITDELMQVRIQGYDYTANDMKYSLMRYLENPVNAEIYSEMNKQPTVTINYRASKYYFEIRLGENLDGSTFSLQSQTLRYFPSEEALPPTGVWIQSAVPQAIKHLSNYLEKDPVSSKEAHSITMNLTWDMPSNLEELLTNGELYYEVYMTDTPDYTGENTPISKGSLLKIYKVNYENGRYSVQEWLGTGESVGTQDQDLFTVEEIGRAHV